MRIAIASSSELALPTISALRSGGQEIVGIITKPDAAQGRGKELAPSELARTLADSFPIFKPVDDGELMKALADLAADLVVTIAYGRLIKAPALAVPRFGWINLHFSLLPKYRGAAPVQWAIRNGDASTGVTVFQLDPGMDTGAIFVTRSRELRGDETSGALLKELSEVGVSAVIEAIEMIKQGQSPVPQSAGGTLAPKLKKSDAKLDWQRPAVELERTIRAMSPQPGAWAQFRGSRMQIHKASVVAGSFANPGSILELEPLTIACGTGGLVLVEIQPEGKRPMLTAAWVRGARLDLNERFE